MDSEEEAAKFCRETANTDLVEVGYTTEIDSDGNKKYFVHPWNENDDKTCYMYFEVGEDGYRYHNGNRIISQDPINIASPPTRALIN